MCLRIGLTSRVSSATSAIGACMYCIAVTAGCHCCLKQVIARRDDMPPPIAADLRPCADGSAVRTALVAWPRRGAPRWDRHTETDGRTDGSLRRLMPSTAGAVGTEALFLLQLFS